jgi:hypothetical protein
MALHLPLAIRIPRRALARRDAFFATLLAAVRPPPSAAALAVGAYAFKNDEEGFARALLARHARLWLYRSNQRAFCGDFLVVDMSSPRPEGRRALVLELKRGAPLRHGGGGAGVQLRNAERAVRGLGVDMLGESPRWELVTGDGERMLAWIGGA